MINLNKVQLAGNIGAHDVRYSASGDPIVNLRIATQEYAGKGKDKRTEWHNVVCFGKTAEFVAEHLDVGCGIFIEQGRLQTRKWEDKDGNPRYSTEVVADRVQPLSWKDKKEVEAPKADTPI